MTRAAFDEFDDARKRQTAQNDAHRIRGKVEAAQQDPLRTGSRWPFELVQNAHDAGPRDGDEYVSIDFILEDDALVVSHTGKPFDSQELAALLYGGSSKGFDDDATTGRFGTGFLVTHGLSTSVTINGILTTLSGKENFHMELQRGGDEASIAKNIAEGDISLEEACIVTDSDVASRPTVLFTYHHPKRDVAKQGLDTLCQTLPYLYGTCDRLGRVQVLDGDRIATYTRHQSTEHKLDGFLLRQTEVVVSDTSEPRRFTAVRIGQNGRRSAILTVVERQDGRVRVSAAPARLPKLFVTLPIHGTTFLPFPFVIDGPFIPLEERDSIHLRDAREEITTALSALPSLISYAMRSTWVDAHLLASLTIPDSNFGSDTDTSEQAWWSDTIRTVAGQAARTPLVETAIGRLPAVDDNARDRASFLIPSIDVVGANPTDYQRIHDLAARVVDLHIPTRNIADDWVAIAQNWNRAGVSVDRLGVRELASRIRSSSVTVNDLPIEGDKFQWLGELFALLAEFDDVNVRPMIDGLLPDQHGQLCDTGDLRIDDNVPERVKDIACDAGIDLRSLLVHHDLWQVLRTDFEEARSLIERLTSKEPLSKPAAIEEILVRLDHQLPDDSNVQASAELPALYASAALAQVLVESDEIQRIRQCPFLTSDNKVLRLLGSGQVLAPIQYWMKSQQPYDNLWTKRRILNDIYYHDSKLQQVIRPLVSARLIIPSPLHRSVRMEITDQYLLNAMAPDDQDMANVTVRDQSFGQIAFLSTDLIQRCGYQPRLAETLLKFVLKVAAKEDKYWGQTREVHGTRRGESVGMRLYSSTWPFELKVRPWVPVRLSEESEDQGYAPGPADETKLRDLYDPSWLRRNPEAVELLVRVFGFKKLSLMIDELGYEEEASLLMLLEEPGLLEAAVGNRELLKIAEEVPQLAELFSELDSSQVPALVDTIRRRTRQAVVNANNRRFGKTMQETLARLLKSHGLNLKLVDRGYDYEVSPGSLDCTFEVGTYLLEVKATTSGDVRLTPLQAQTASQCPDQFILCVIDLRGKSSSVLGTLNAFEPLSAAVLSGIADNLQQYARIASGVGDHTVEVYESVDSLSKPDEPIRLCNRQELRYGVLKSLWTNGISLDEWIQSLQNNRD